AGVGLRSARDDPVLQELFGRLVESPGGDLLRGSVGDAHNDVRIPGARARTVEFRRRRGMVRVAVVNPDQVQASRPGVVVGMEEFQRIDLVSSRAVRHRDVLRAFRFLDPARLADMAQEEAAALLGESLSRVTLHGADDGRANLDHDPFSQYRSSRYRSPLSGKMTTTRPCEIRSARRRAASNAAPLDVPTGRPSSGARRRTACWASSVATARTSSGIFGSQMPGTREL